MSILIIRAMRNFFIELTICICIVLCSTSHLFAQGILGPEYQVKAAFIYNFAKFVEWPEDVSKNNNRHITLCIIPDNPDTDCFYSLNNKTVGDKKIVIKKRPDINDTDSCHILFIDTSDKKLVRDILKKVRDKSILTIGNCEGFSQEGGIINFFMEEEKMRFEVNIDAAKRAGLKLGSQILMSAEIVQERHN